MARSAISFVQSRSVTFRVASAVRILSLRGASLTRATYETPPRRVKATRKTARSVTFRS